MSSDKHEVRAWIYDAEVCVFEKMWSSGHDLESGKAVLFGYPDWQEGWENWWDESD